MKKLFVLVLLGAMFFSSHAKADSFSLVAVAPDTLQDPQSIVEDNFDMYQADNSIIGQSEWENYANGANFIIKTIGLNSLDKWLYNNSLGDSAITKYGTPLADGKQSITIRTQNRTSWGLYPDGNVQVRLSQGQSFSSNVFVAVSFKKNGNVAYYDPIFDSYVNFAIYPDNKSVKLEIEWQSENQTARYRINGALWTDWHTFSGASSFNYFDNLGLDFYLPSGAGGVYFNNLY